MKKIIALGGCHITNGEKTKLFNNPSIVINKKIPYRLYNKPNKSLEILDYYLKLFKDDEILVILQVGNVEFSNALGNLIDTQFLKKTFAKLYLQKTIDNTDAISEFDRNAMNGFLKALRFLIYLIIIPLNIISINLLYVHKLFKLKKKLKNYPYIRQIFLITPFYSGLNFNWIFRKYCNILMDYIFKNEKQYNIIDGYNLTKDDNSILSDGFHLNNHGLQILSEAVLFEIENIEFANEKLVYNIAQ